MKRTVFFRNRKGFIMDMKEMNEEDLARGYIITLESKPPSVSFVSETEVPPNPELRVKQKEWVLIDWYRQTTVPGAYWVDAIESREC